MINVHEEKEVPCEDCHKVFKSVMLKIKHVIKVHGKYTSCLMCEVTFSSNSYLRAHIQNVHSQESKENQFSCIYCDKNFSSKQMLKMHDLNSCPTKFSETVKCNQCDKPFKGKGALKNHMKVHEMKTSLPKVRVKCYICPKEIWENNLKSHLNTHTKQVQTHIGFGSFERSKKEIICDQCELMFSNTFSLKRHMKIVHKINSDRVDSKKRNNVINYSCNKCPLTFSSNYSLKRHMQKIHKVTPDKQTDDRIIYYKDHFMTRVNNNCDIEVETKDHKSVTVSLNQDESDLCEYMNGFLIEVNIVLFKVPSLDSF